MRLIIALFAAVLALAAPAFADNWKKVGSVTFLDPFLEQVIPIDEASGHLRAVRFVVKGADVEIASVRILYASGRSEDIRVKSVFRAGTTSRNIDLPGEVRQVKSITVVYRAHGQATFDIIGDVKEVPQWVQLGCKSVGFFADRDVIQANGGDRNFTAIRLRVASLPVEFYELTLVYGNGKKQTYKVRVKVPAGTTTIGIDLIGEKRAISRIELIYRSEPKQNKTATVCVDGYRLP